MLLENLFSLKKKILVVVGGTDCQNGKKITAKTNIDNKNYHCPTASPHHFNPEYIGIAPLSLKYNYYS